MDKDNSYLHISRVILKPVAHKWNYKKNIAWLSDVSLAWSWELSIC